MTSSPPDPHARGEHWADALFVVLWLAAVVLVARVPCAIIFDQKFILHAMAPGHVPGFEEGIASHWIAGGLRRTLALSPEDLNTWVRGVALTIFVIPAYLLARAVLDTQWARSAFCLLIFLSRAPFLWLSSELFTGGFLALSMYAVVSSWPAYLVGATLALFGLAKPDTALVAFALATYLVLARSSFYYRSPALGGSFVGLFGLAVLPGLISGKGMRGDGRSLMAFGQHYAVLFSRHQLVQPSSPLQPWEQWKGYFGAVFPASNSVWDAVHTHPRAYVDFLALSVVAGLDSFLRLFKMLGTFPILRGTRFRQPTPFERLVLVSVIGVFPWILVSFPHVRYWVRYFPLMLLVLLAFTERVFREEGTRSRLARGLAVVVVLALEIEAVSAYHYLSEVTLGYHAVWWFPD